MLEANTSHLRPEDFVHSRTTFDRSRLQLREIAPYFQLVALTVALAVSRLNPAALDLDNTTKRDSLTISIPNSVSAEEQFVFVPPLPVDEDGEPFLELTENPDERLREMGIDPKSLE